MIRVELYFEASDDEIVKTGAYASQIMERFIDSLTTYYHGDEVGYILSRNLLDRNDQVIGKMKWIRKD